MDILQITRFEGFRFDKGGYHWEDKLTVWYFNEDGYLDKCEKDDWNRPKVSSMYLIDGRVPRMGQNYTKRGNAIVSKLMQIVNETLKDGMSLTKPKSQFLETAYSNSKELTEESLYNYVNSNPELFIKNYLTREKAKYGIITSTGKVSFRKKVGNKKASTFDFVSVDYSLISRSNKELFPIIKDHQNEIMTDAYQKIKEKMDGKKFEIPVSFLQPYSMMITQDKLLHIDFELKEV